MNELKGCPFCGGKARLVVFKDPYVTSFINYNFSVSCDDCGGEGYSSDVAHNSDCREAILEAIAAWNKRIE